MRTLNPVEAESIEQMQQIAQNQIQAKIDELQERIVALEALKSQVNSVVNYETYLQVTFDIRYHGDDEELTALGILGNHYQTMENGDYF